MLIPNVWQKWAISASSSGVGSDADLGPRSSIATHSFRRLRIATDSS
jgi:hypothetical protein